MTFALKHPLTGRVIPVNSDTLRGLHACLEALAQRKLWAPIPDKDGVPHPQRLAFESLADITGYGGAAGGGKTDLACGLALTEHRKIMMLRRVGTEPPRRRRVSSMYSIASSWGPGW